MINLKEFKNQSGVTKELPKKDHSLYPLQIGFKVESKFSVLQRNLRKKIYYLIEELRVTGFHKDISMWNLIFLNMFFAFVLYYVTSLYYSKLPAEIGLNLDMDKNYDFLISKSWLYLPTFLHLIFAISVFVINLRAYRRLSHLMVASFFHCLVLMYFEIVGLMALIRYFL